MRIKTTYKLIFLAAALFFINSCSTYDYKVESVKEVKLSEMSLDDKIAQMMIIEGKIENLAAFFYFHWQMKMNMLI